MVTISNLRNALATPAKSFRRLKEFKWDNAPIVRSTYFAETRIRIGNCPYLLSMPLSPVAIHRVERFCNLRCHLKSEIAPPLRIMRDEMLYIDPTQRELYCDILLEPLPNALPYCDAVANAADDKVEAENLLAALDELEEELKLIDISLNNLRKENLLIDQRGLLRPIRWYHATKRAGGDKMAFEQLRNEITLNQEALELHDSQHAYSAPPIIEGHISTGPMIEGLIAVKDESGWGFVDGNNHSIIESKFGWVSDFREGRAEVEFEGLMGLIDKSGNYIIDPIYDVLNYDEVSGQSRAKRNGEWHTFNYLGAELQDAQQLNTEYEATTSTHKITNK